MKVLHPMPFGAHWLGHDGVRFALWAPGINQVQLVVATQGAPAERCAMQRCDGGWHECVMQTARPGTRYGFQVGLDRPVPDPASRFNPSGVHDLSEVVDTQGYDWRVRDWQGRKWHTATVYELHVGTFTPEGTLAAATARLPYLCELGITALQLMPLAAFAGTRGWGYDGVLPYALHATYGRPDDLKHFVDAAHMLGMMVLLDVVYNHFGPEGNYLNAYCPQFYNPRLATPWGPAIAFDGAAATTVRRFFIDNALYWVEQYQLDGLRLDAVHAMHDASARHLVEDIAAALRDGPGGRRMVHLVLENDDNTARWLRRDAQARPLVATAQWNDDWHHAAHVLATGEADSYYADYADDACSPAALLAHSLAEGFIYQGQPSAHREGRPRGAPSGDLPSSVFINFLQNHDQIGNRALGERLDALAAPSRVQALLVCLLLAPQVPMLFMGEEFAATTPFFYFCDFAGELGQAVARGRRAEFAAFAAGPGERIPDPNALTSFTDSQLHWGDAAGARGRQRLTLVRQLLELRRLHLQPYLPLQTHGGRWRLAGDSFEVEWALGDHLLWTMRANFGATAVALAPAEGEVEVYRCAVTEAGGDARWLASDEVQVTCLHRATA